MGNLEIGSVGSRCAMRRRAALEQCRSTSRRNVSSLEGKEKAWCSQPKAESECKGACLNTWGIFLLSFMTLSDLPLSLLLWLQTQWLDCFTSRQVMLCYVETALIKVCMWWVRKRRAFKRTESGPVTKKKETECQNDTRKRREVQKAVCFELL